MFYCYFAVYVYGRIGGGRGTYRESACVRCLLDDLAREVHAVLFRLSRLLSKKFYTRYSLQIFVQCVVFVVCSVCRICFVQVRSFHFFKLHIKKQLQ